MPLALLRGKGEAQKHATTKADGNRQAYGARSKSRAKAKAFTRAAWRECEGRAVGGFSAKRGGGQIAEERRNEALQEILETAPKEGSYYDCFPPLSDL